MMQCHYTKYYTSVLYLFIYVFLFSTPQPLVSKLAQTWFVIVYFSIREISFISEAVIYPQI